MADLCLSCGEYVGQNAEDSPYCKCHREELKKLKDDSEKYNSLMKANSEVVQHNINITKEHQIVERLKEELDWFNKYNNIDSDWNAPSVRDLLEKILEGEK